MVHTLFSEISHKITPKKIFFKKDEPTEKKEATFVFLSTENKPITEMAMIFLLT
jgi:hypothetical protein